MEITTNPLKNTPTLYFATTTSGKAKHITVTARPGQRMLRLDKTLGDRVNTLALPSPLANSRIRHIDVQNRLRSRRIIRPAKQTLLVRPCKG